MKGMVQSLASYIMQGRLQAMAVASLLAILALRFPPINVVSLATIALVTLRKGSMEGLYVLGCSLVAAGLLGVLVSGNFTFIFIYLLASWLPIWLVSIVLREGRHLSLAVDIAVFLGILAVIIAYITMPDPAALWKDFLSQLAATQANANIPAESLQKNIDNMSKLMTGMIAAASVTSLLLGLFLARWWQAVLYNPGGFRQEFLALSSRPRFIWGTFIVVGMAFAKLGTLSALAANIAVVLLILYIIIGVAVLHSLLARKAAAVYLLPLFYIVIILIPHAMLFVALAGFADPWLDLRKIKT